MHRPIDRILLALTILLVVGGLIILASASSSISEQNFGNTYHYEIRQLLAVLVGFAALFVASRISYRVWRRVALPLLLVSIALAVAVFSRFGFSHGGATRWLNLGPLTFQPSEALKISLILYLATWLDRRKTEAKEFLSAFLPFLIVTGAVAAILVAQRDLGTLIVIGSSAAVLYFLGGGRVTQLGALILLALVAGVILISFEPYRANRITAFLHPNSDPAGASYHIRQALIAIGSGGFFGKGYGQSAAKTHYLPEAAGDSVFAVYVEEFGLVGALGMLAAYLAFFFRCLLLARRIPDFFGKLLAAGVGSLVIIQALVHMGAISGVIPLTGIPLPFVSYGGTALVMMLGAVGIVLSASREQRNEG